MTTDSHGRLIPARSNSRGAPSSGELALLKPGLANQGTTRKGIDDEVVCGRSRPVTAAVLTGIAVGATARLTKAQYVAKLRVANAASAKVDDAAGAAVSSNSKTPPQVRALFMAMGRTHVAIGREFATLAPPPTAAKGNRDFAHAEVLFGQQDESIAAKLPTTSRAAMLKYLQSLKPPSGGALLDRATTELHAAGFRA
jgi:hypothetical protein